MSEGSAGRLRFHWFLPTNGDGRDIVGGGHGVATGAAGAIRPPSIAYLGQIARSAEQLGFEGALTPTGAWCEDAWLATAMLTEVTERLKFLVAFRPGQISPTLSAQMASTFQRLSGGRLLLNVVTGGESAEQRAYGDFLDKDARYERTAEFLDIVTRLWRGESVTTAGKHLSVAGARLSRLPDPVPDVYFGGSSHAAGPVAARYANVYLTWGEPPAAVDTKLRWIEALGAKEDRNPPRFGIRLHVVTRDTSEEAWRAAGRLIERVDDDMIRKVQEGLATSESEGQRRMRELHHGGDRSNLTIAPNLWAGVGLVRGGAGTALVGSHAEVADRIEEYASLGISEFVLSGYPHLEEAYWFGEGVLPELERRGRWQHPAPSGYGEQAITPFAPTHAGPGVPRGAGHRGEGRLMTTIAVVTGNPKPRSRTQSVALAVASAVAAALKGPADHLVIDLADHAPRLFDWSDPELTRLNSEVAAADVAIFASPTYKAAYTGLLKAFLDRYGSNGLAGVTAIPVMTGGWPGHLLAVEVHLRPVLVELGASVPSRGVYVTEPELADLDKAVGKWADAAIPLITRSL